MTSNREDYLKVIYEAGGMESYVSNKTISQQLGVAAGSVSEMVAKLKSEHLIDSKPYRGVKLTENGLEACIELVRSHRLWEVFLLKHLNYSWREAHEDAHLLEHVAPKRMVERLAVFLENPTHCPHGAIIPKQGECFPKEMDLDSLASLSVGEKAWVVRVSEESELLDYLSKVGLLTDSEIEIISKDEYEGPITFKQNNTQQMISYKAATKVYIRK